MLCAPDQRRKTVISNKQDSGLLLAKVIYTSMRAALTQNHDFRATYAAWKKHFSFFFPANSLIIKRVIQNHILYTLQGHDWGRRGFLHFSQLQNCIYPEQNCLASLLTTERKNSYRIVLYLRQLNVEYTCYDLQIIMCDINHKSFCQNSSSTSPWRPGLKFQCCLRHVSMVTGICISCSAGQLLSWVLVKTHVKISIYICGKMVKGGKRHFPASKGGEWVRNL